MYKTLRNDKRRSRLPILPLSERLTVGIADAGALGIFGDSRRSAGLPATATIVWLATGIVGAAVAHCLLHGMNAAAVEARTLVYNPAMRCVFADRRDEISDRMMAVKPLHPPHQRCSGLSER